MERFRPKFSYDSESDESLELSIFDDDDAPQPQARQAVKSLDDLNVQSSQSSVSGLDLTGDRRGSGDLIVPNEARDSDSLSDDYAQEGQDLPQGRDEYADTKARHDDQEEGQTDEADGRPCPGAIESKGLISGRPQIDCKEDAVAGPSHDVDAATGAPDTASAKPTRKSRAMVSSMPLCLPSRRKLQAMTRDTVLVEVPDSKLKLANETGAIGRMAVNDVTEDIVLDLMGTEFFANACRGPSLLLVDIGKTDATIEAVFNSMLKLRVKRHHFGDLNPFTTGAAGVEEEALSFDEVDPDAEDSSDSDAPAARPSKNSRKGKRGKGKAGRYKGKAKGAKKARKSSKAR